MVKKTFRFLALALSLALLMPLGAFPAAALTTKITLGSGAALPDNFVIGEGYEETIRLKVPGKKTTFTSAKPEVLTVDPTTGVVTLKGPGSSKITAKDARTGKVLATTTVHVLLRSSAVLPDREEIVVAVGETAELSVSLDPVGSTDAIRYTVGDKTVATVGAATGKVTGVAPGRTTVTVAAKETPATATSAVANRTAKVKITVVAPEDKPADAGSAAAADYTFVDTKLTAPEHIVLNEGEEYRLSVLSEPAAADGSLSLRIPDDEVLEQSDAWTVTALEPGYSTLFVYRCFTRDEASKTCYRSAFAVIPVTVLPAGEDKEDWLLDHMEDEEPYDTASVLSEGNVLVLCVLAAAGAAGIVGAVLYGKRKKRNQDE